MLFERKVKFLYIKIRLKDSFFLIHVSILTLKIFKSAQKGVG